MIEEVVHAVNIVSTYFNSLNDKSSDKEISEAVMISNYLDLMQEKFVDSIIKPKLEQRIIINTGAKA